MQAGLKKCNCIHGIFYAVFWGVSNVNISTYLLETSVLYLFRLLEFGGTAYFVGSILKY